MSSQPAQPSGYGACVKNPESWWRDAYTLLRDQPQNERLTRPAVHFGSLNAAKSSSARFASCKPGTSIFDANAEQGKETDMPQVSLAPRRKRMPHAPQVKVVVDTDLIEISKERDSSHCMIAEAVRDAVPNAHSIAVDLQTIRFSLPEKGLRYTYLTPRIAQTALVQFDQGIAPEPFDFRLQGGQVTAMATRKKSPVAPRSTERSPAQQAALKKARKSKGLDLDKQQLGAPTAGNGVLRRVGGRTPPTTPFSRRRSFGLRALVL